MRAGGRPTRRAHPQRGAFAWEPRTWSHGAMSGPNGFDFRTRPNGEVHIFSQGKLAKMLKGKDAEAFLAAAEKGDTQVLMAEAVGAAGSGGRVSGGPSGPGSNLHGNGASHAPTVFRRKTG